MTTVTDRFNTQHPVVQFERVEDELKLIASENGCTAEVVREGWQLMDDNELGTRMIVTGGEVMEISVSTATGARGFQITPDTYKGVSNGNTNSNNSK